MTWTLLAAAPISVPFDITRATRIRCYPAEERARADASNAHASTPIRTIVVEIGCNTAATRLSIVTDMSGQLLAAL